MYTPSCYKRLISQELCLLIFVYLGCKHTCYGPCSTMTPRHKNETPRDINHELNSLTRKTKHATGSQKPHICPQRSVVRSSEAIPPTISLSLVQSLAKHLQSVRKNKALILVAVHIPPHAYRKHGAVQKRHAWRPRRVFLSTPRGVHCLRLPYYIFKPNTGLIRPSVLLNSKRVSAQVTCCRAACGG